MQTLQCQNSLPNRKLQAPLKNFQTSGAPAKSESNMAVSSPAGPKLTGRGSLIAMELKQERENHEESASKHCIRMCGDVCVGTGFGNHHNDDHNRRQRDDYGVHSGECDRSKAN